MELTAASWFEDPEQVLATLRSARRAAVPRLPTIAGYDELRELKRGGQGVVYTATQASTRRRVAIKLLSGGAASSERALRRFEREIDLAATLDHPNIVRIYDSGRTAEGAPYFVMEFIEGVALDALFPRIEAADRPLERAAIVQHIARFITICDAVAYAHQRGVIHRDLKPSNIRVDPKGVPHVLDFGLAKALGESEPNATQVSMTGEFMGSLPWASPEQVDSDVRQVDVRTDIYALGVMLHQTVTGRFPYPVTGSFRTVLDTIVRQTPTPARQHNPNCDADLEIIIRKCLEKETARRYQSATDLATDLRRYLADEPIEARRDSGWYTLRKTMWRYRAPVGVALSIFGLSIASAIAMGVLYQRAKVAERGAVEAREEAVVAKDAAEREARTTKSVNTLLTKMLQTPFASGREARVADVLDDFASQLDADRTLQPNIEHALRVILAGAYGGLGDYATAQQQLDSAGRLAAGTSTIDQDGRADELSYRAWTLYQAGRLEEAAALYRDLLAGLEQRLPQHDRRICSAKNDLAIVLDEVGRSHDALELLESAYASLETSHASAAADTTVTLGNLANVNHSLGRLEEAERLLRKRLALSIERLGENHRDTLTAKSNLSSLLIDIGRYDEALDLCRVVLDARQKMLGPSHRETVMAINNLGTTLLAAGRRDEAIDHFRDAFARGEKSLGADHPATIIAEGNLADALSESTRIDEAESLTRDCLARRIRVFGRDAASTLTTRNNLATVLMRQNLNNEAYELLVEIVRQLRDQNGDDHIITATAKQNLASCLADIGAADAAIPLIEEVFATRLKLLGPAHFDTLAARHKRAHFELDRDRPHDAVRRFRELLPEESAALGRDNLLTALTTAALARALADCGEFEESLCLFEDAIETHVRLFGADHPRTARARGFAEHARAMADQARAAK